LVFTPSFPIRNTKDIKRLEQTPLVDALTVQNTYEIFTNSAKVFAGKTALRFLKTAEPGGETATLNFGELLQGIHRTANMLYALGMGSKDTVSILLPACLEYHLALWGGEAAGIANPLNPLLSEGKLVELMEASNTKILITYGAEADVNYWQKALSLKDKVSALECIVRVMPSDADRSITATLPEGVIDFQDASSRQPDDYLVSGRVIKPDDIAAYFHTGGTTGSPKLAKHSHFNQVFSAWASVKLQGISHTDRIINGYPLFHVAGVLPGALTALSAGTETLIPTTTLMRNREIIANFWKLVEYHKITAISAVPTVLAALAAVPLNGADISSVNYCRTGAAPLPAELAQRFKTLFGLHIHESLGMTEMAGISSITPPGVEAPVGCVGFPLPYSNYKIVTIDTNGAPTDEELEAGGIGGVLVKSPNVFNGYLNDTATRETFTDDGWLITGDIGFIDKQGRLNLRGRSKDLIIRSGHNIDPKMIEDALSSHPAVELCAAVGAPDPYAGELPVAYVTLRPETHANEKELTEFIANSVDEIPAKPKSVTILNSMPMTNVGKIFKPELRRLAAEQTIKNRVKEMLKEITGVGSVLVEARLDESGNPSIHIYLDAGEEETIQMTAELRKFPITIFFREGKTIS
jgi:fatty-acyl-CoA synthase